MAHSWQTEGDALVCDRQFADFAQALAYVNRVAAVAQARNHHPDLLLHSWNKVRLTLSTHDAGGTVTDADHAMAEAIDALGEA